MMADILGDLPRGEPSMGILLGRLNRDVARLTRHYENCKELDEMDPEDAARIAIEDIELVVRVRGHDRQYLLNPKCFGVANFAQLIPALQQSETEAAAVALVETAGTVRVMYELVFPRDGEDHGGQS